MEANLFQLALIALMFGMFNRNGPICILGWAEQFPVLEGFLIGLILGDPITGLAVGATINLVYLVNLDIGTVVVANSHAGATIGVTMAIVAGLDTGAAVALAAPFAAAATFLTPAIQTINIPFASRVSASAKAGNYRAMYAWHWSAWVLSWIIGAVPMFIALALGSNVVEGVFNAMPAAVMNGLNEVAKVMPALGIAMGLKMIGSRNGYMAFFILAFVAAETLGLNTLTLVVLAALGVWIFVAFRKTKAIHDDMVEHVEPEATNGRILNFKTVMKAIWQWYISFYASIGYEKMSGTGVMVAMVPIMKALYPNDKAKQAEELAKYDCYFQTNPQFNSFILGMEIAMEEDRAQGAPIDPEAIVATQTSLMGPLAGIGDPVFQTIWKPLVASIGITLALDGNWIGGIFPFVTTIIFMLVAMYVGAKASYNGGHGLIGKLFSTGLIDEVTHYASIIGCVAFGALAANTVTVACGIEFTIGEAATLNLQTGLFDAIFPGLLPLALCLVTYYYLAKKEVKITTMLLIMLIGSIVLGAIGVLA